MKSSQSARCTISSSQITVVRSDKNDSSVMDDPPPLLQSALLLPVLLLPLLPAGLPVQLGPQLAPDPTEAGN